MPIYVISQREALSIIQSSKPIGRYISLENDAFVAIDNSSGDAWTEEFSSISDSINYLQGADFYE